MSTGSFVHPVRKASVVASAWAISAVRFIASFFADDVLYNRPLL
jgi:hypothetical protein